MTNMSEIGFELVDMERVRGNDYNLIGTVYRETKNFGMHKMFSLIDVLGSFESGSRPKGGVSGISEGAISLGAEHIGDDGKLNLTKVKFIPIEFFINAKRGFVKKNDILICKDGALTGKVCYIDSDFHIEEVLVNEHVYILRANQKLILQKYLFYCLNNKYIQLQIKNLAYNKSAQPGLNSNHLRYILLPVPPLEEQQEIVDELDSYQKIIDGAKQVMDSWRNI